MNYRIIHGHELTPALISRWQEIQQADPSLVNPYFSPGFILAVATVRDDVRIAVMEEGNRVVGFFPFQRGAWGIARPVGLGLSDYHGVIAGPEAGWMATELLRGCGLVRWEFDHLPVSQAGFASFHAQVSDSPIIETAQGYEDFAASRDKSGRNISIKVRGCALWRLYRHGNQSQPARFGQQHHDSQRRHPW